MDTIEVITAFFTAFGKLDYRQMNGLYADDIIYSDPLYGLLQGTSVKDKWELICTGLNDLKLTIIKTEVIDHEYVTCQWKATYFSARSGKYIVFNSKSFMKIIDGKIAEQSEGYSLTKWIGKTYGIRGRLFGWTNFMKRKVQKKYQLNLERFSKSKTIFPADQKRRHISDSFDH